MIAEINGRSVPADGGTVPVSHASPIPANGWPLHPFQIVSLYDVIKFKARDFFKLVSHLKGLQSAIGSVRFEHPDKDQEIDDNGKTVYGGDVEDLRVICQEMGLTLSAMLLEEVGNSLKRSSCKFFSLEQDLREVERRIDHEMSLFLFMVIPREKTDYFEKVDLFGPEVNAAFPSTVYDIEESGNSYASGRNTACVFHLMRVLEKDYTQWRVS